MIQVLALFCAWGMVYLAVVLTEPKKHPRAAAVLAVLAAVLLALLFVRWLVGGA